MLCCAVIIEGCRATTGWRCKPLDLRKTGVHAQSWNVQAALNTSMTQVYILNVSHRF